MDEITKDGLYAGLKKEKVLIMQNLTKQTFIPIFNEMNLVENEYCKQCNACYKTPILPWIVGGEYGKSEYKLMIVGKPHRGEGVKVSDCAFFMDYCIDWLIDDC